MTTDGLDTTPKTNLWIKIVLSDDERRKGEEAIAWALKALDNFPSDEELERRKNTLEKQLITYQLTTQNERVERYKTTGEMIEEDSWDSIQTYLTEEEKIAIPVLEEKDITEMQKHEREYKGEKYHILTYKKLWEQYTAIQVPEQIKKMKYKNTYEGRQLLGFKEKGRYPAFLTDEKLESALNQDWLIWKSSPATNEDNEPKTNIKLYNDWNPTWDIIREVAKTWWRMMTITDNIIMTELIKW
jgi:hypothetical protein